MLEDIWTQTEPLIANLLVVSLVALLGSLTVAVPVLIRKGVNASVAYFETKTGIVVEQKWQDDIHRAATTGALSAIEKVREGLIVDSQEAKVAVILAHIGESVKDAVDGLKPDPQVLLNIALSKLLAAEGKTEVKAVA